MPRLQTVERELIEKKFTYLQLTDNYKCNICEKVYNGIKRNNFLFAAKDHLKRIHTQILQEIQDKLQSKDQLRLDNFGNAVFNYEKNWNNAILAFVKTSHPVNIFRSENNRQFLKASQGLGGDSRLSSLKSVDFFGVQLDHWTSASHKNVLVVIVSWVTDEWSHKVQVIDFKEVEKTTGLITASDFRETLMSVNLGPSLCVVYQSDNCSSMMAASRIFRTSILDEAEDFPALRLLKFLIFFRKFFERLQTVPLQFFKILQHNGC